MRLVLAVAFVAAVVTGCSEPPAARSVREAGGRPAIGAFVPSGVWNDLGPLKDLERRVGGTFAVAHWYTSWDVPYDPVPVNDLLSHGRTPLVTWQSHTQTPADIAAGRYDAYIRAWARGVGAAPGTVYVRLFPEMNGEWTPWNGDPEALKSAWRHVVSVFRAEGTANVRWVFTPNVTDEPRTKENAMELYYPGAEFADVIGLDGYNWGTARPAIGWRTFDEVFESGYERITKLGDQPVWLAEVASSEQGGDKAEWVEDMLLSTAFPRVAAMVWFNENKETDWRIESSVGSLEAFRNYFASHATEPTEAAGQEIDPASASAVPASLSMRGTLRER